MESLHPYNYDNWKTNAPEAPEIDWDASQADIDAPCPFCNQSDFLELENAFVLCQNCQARGPEALDPAAAVAMWNDRAD